MKITKECKICKRRAKKNTDFDGESYCRKHYYMAREGKIGGKVSKSNDKS